jgi:hypothetical protein
MREVLCPVVVGRDEELAILEQSLQEARGGRGGVLLLLGEAGIGKSRPAREAAAAAAGRGCGSWSGGRAAAGRSRTGRSPRRCSARSAPVGGKAGARVSGLDAAEGLLAIARERLPAATAPTGRRPPLRAERPRRAGGTAGLGRAGTRGRRRGLDPIRVRRPGGGLAVRCRLRPGTRAVREAGEQRARATITASFAPFRQPDGRYRLENAFRYGVARA